MADLRLLGDVGAAALINLLVDESQRANWSRIRSALRYFGSIAEEPLLAAWRSNVPKLQAEAAKALGYIRTSAALDALYLPSLSSQTDPFIRDVAQRSLKRLSGRLPSQTEAEARLYKSSRDYLLDRIVINRAPHEFVKWWRWDNESQSLKMNWMPAETVARIRAFRRASDLLRLSSQREDYQRLFWLTRLESAKRASGLDPAFAGCFGSKDRGGHRFRYGFGCTG